MSAFLRTQLCVDFGIEYPILLAGMGVKGRATPPPLVAAVCEAGGMGWMRTRCAAAFVPCAT